MRAQLLAAAAAVGAIGIGALAWWSTQPIHEPDAAPPPSSGDNVLVLLYDDAGVEKIQLQITKMLGDWIRCQQDPRDDPHERAA